MAISQFGGAFCRCHHVKTVDLRAAIREQHQKRKSKQEKYMTAPPAIAEVAFDGIVATAIPTSSSTTAA